MSFMNRMVDIYSISSIREMIMGRVDDVVMVKGVEKGLRGV